MNIEKLLNTIIEAGKMLVESGAEVNRVEETMVRMCRCFEGIEYADSYVTLTGIMFSLTYENKTITRICRVHTGEVDLNRIDQINTLSRSICMNPISVDELANELEKIKKIKVTKKKKKAFTADEMERMRIACTDIRDRALIEMLASTGCRVSELSSIKLNDIDFIRKKVRIIGKGDKERTVFISDQAMIYLNRYLETRKDNNISLFVSKRYPYGQLRKDGIRDC